jgi:hypothetical protein
MLFWISVGVFTAVISMSLVIHKRESDSDFLKLNSHPKKKRSTIEFAKGDQLLFDQEHWTIQDIAIANDGIKMMHIAVLDSPNFFWVVLENKQKKILNGFYKINTKLDEKRVLTDIFSLDNATYSIKFKTRMASETHLNCLWGEAKSFSVFVYEDRQQKRFFIQIMNEEMSCYLQGDNLASDKIMFLSQT